MIDEKGRLFGKINIVDLLVILSSSSPAAAAPSAAAAPAPM